MADINKDIERVAVLVPKALVVGAIREACSTLEGEKQDTIITLHITVNGKRVADLNVQGETLADASKRAVEAQVRLIDVLLAVGQMEVETQS